MAGALLLGWGPGSASAWAGPTDLADQTESGPPLPVELAGQPVAGVYRSVDANGVVEFNDLGAGESVALVVIPAANQAERARVAERNLSIAAVAEQLAAARAGREQSQRDAQALRAGRKRLLAREAATEPAATGYSPAFVRPYWQNPRRRAGVRPPLYSRDYRPDRPRRRYGRKQAQGEVPSRRADTLIMRDRRPTP